MATLTQAVDAITALENTVSTKIQSIDAAVAQAQADVDGFIANAKPISQVYLPATWAWTGVIVVGTQSPPIQSTTITLTKPSKVLCVAQFHCRHIGKIDDFIGISVNGDVIDNHVAQLLQADLPNVGEWYAMSPIRVVDLPAGTHTISIVANRTRQDANNTDNNLYLSGASIQVLAV